MLFTQGKRYGLDSMGKIKRGEMYSKLVKPNFDKIKKHLKHGATESQIADDIGVSLSSWNRFKRIHPEFNDLCKNGRHVLVMELRGALVKRGLGFKYTETKTYTKNGETTIETVEKYALPDVAALNLALKNYDSENWANDPALLEIKKQELELKKTMAENQNW